MIFILLLIPFMLFGAPQAVYLTYGGPPESSMSVQWISDINQTSNVLTLEHEGKSYTFQGTSMILPTDTTYLVHKVNLTDLKSDTLYQFKLQDKGYYKFKTMPKSLSREVTFVFGGDFYHDTLELLTRVNQIAAKKNPDFALIGGDIAYASNVFSFMPENTKRWIDWITTYSATMIRDDGTMIPLLPVIGNHDVNGRYSQTPKQAETFYTLFSTLPGPQGYALVDFSNYLSIFLLDSGHTHAIDGAQTAWLNEELSKREGQKYKIALYHVPAYPSCRKLTARMSPEVREHWVPLFEKYHLTAALENHDHCYKRTYPLIGGKAVDKGGVVYIGDGGWGVEKPRTPKNKEEIPFIEKTVSKTQFGFAKVTNEALFFEAIDKDGVIFDTFSIPSSQNVSVLPPVLTY